MTPPVKESRHPHPQPLPTRGRGAHRVCRRIVHQTQRNVPSYIAAVLPLSRGRTQRVPIAHLRQGAASLIDTRLFLDAAVAQRQSNRFVSDRLTVRIRPAAPAVFSAELGPCVAPASTCIARAWRNTASRNNASAVIAGLDPAIHPVRKKFLRRTMDPRVKPAGDGVSPLRLATSAASTRARASAPRRAARTTSRPRPCRGS
jgi:hypothetical protein